MTKEHIRITYGLRSTPYLYTSNGSVVDRDGYEIVAKGDMDTAEMKFLVYARNNWNTICRLLGEDTYIQSKRGVYAFTDDAVPVKHILLSLLELRRDVLLESKLIELHGDFYVEDSKRFSVIRLLDSIKPFIETTRTTHDNGKDIIRARLSLPLIYDKRIRDLQDQASILDNENTALQRKVSNLESMRVVRFVRWCKKIWPF